MLKNNTLIIPQEDQKKEIIEDELITNNNETKILTKPKRPVSDAQRAHLNNIRVKALETKAQMKEDFPKKHQRENLQK